jgi:hypothetical protein
VDIKKRSKIAQRVFQECLATLESKGEDYKVNNDANSNFEEVAKRLRDKVGKYDVWQVYFQKHITAIEKWCASTDLASEPIEGRIIDAINYLFILYSMAVDDFLIPEPTDLRCDDDQP